MKNIMQIGRDLIERGEDFVIAKVIQTSGSTPRKRGAWLLMTKEGMAYGTVGGGKLEFLVESICRETLNTKESKIHEFSLTSADQKGIDMRCGGDASVSIDYIDHLHPESFEEDAFENHATALIYGAGHVGKEIAKILSYVGFRIVVLDDRPEFANLDRFPQANDIIVLDHYNNAFENFIIDEDSYIIIVTRGHSGDYDVLKQALAFDCAYIGMIGSRKKIAVVYDQLRKDSFSEKDFARVHAPIGLEISAETPEEIAISIAAEIIKVRADLEAADAMKAEK